MFTFPCLMSRTEPRLRPGRPSRLAALLGVVALAGCALMPAQTPSRHGHTSAISAPALTLLGRAAKLAKADSGQREAAVRAARQRRQNTPGPVSDAYLAIALGSPHQHLYNPQEAARYAQLALNAKSAPWDPDARQYLRDLVRLYGALDDEFATRQRIADLQRQLAQAQHKLKALTNVETHLDSTSSKP